MSQEVRRGPAPLPTRPIICCNPPCKRRRKYWQMFCHPCWKSLPEDFRYQFFQTKARSPERLQMVKRALDLIDSIQYDIRGLTG